ncbi:hypothetical protein GF327_03860 [Candidatus Woesearchaeota archaeon]|nr:hypothetical protein [Candidatus Woesearchaeota archaeon]
MKNKIVLTLFIITLIPIGMSNSFNAQITRKDSGIKIENENYLIDWELEVTGYSPVTGKFVLEGRSLKSKNADRTVDIAVISPVKFRQGSKAFVKKAVEKTITREKSYTCEGEDYGWSDADEIYCIKAISYKDNSTNKTVNENKTFYFKVGEGAQIENLDQGVKYVWNESYTREEKKAVDISSEFNYINFKTDYGENIYYVDDVEFKAGEDNKFEFEVDVDKTELPVKYTVCVGDIEKRELYFCLDPIITNSRTWTTDADWNNGTCENCTVEDGKVRLGNYLNSSDLKVCYSFENDSTDSTDNKEHGVIEGNPTFSFGKINNAIYLDGSGDAVDLGTNLSKHFSDHFFTITGWFNSSYSSDNQYIIASSQSQGCQHTKVRIDSDGKIRFGVTDVNGAGNDDNDIRTTSSGYNDGDWHHFAVLINGTDADHMYIYIDGSKKNVNILSNEGEIGDWDPFDCQTRIGDSYDYVNGVLDEIKFYNRSLSDEEILNDYNSDSGVSCELVYSSYLLSLWSYREGLSPQTGSKIINQTFNMEIASGSDIFYRFNTSNSSLDSSSWINITGASYTLNYSDYSIQIGDEIYEQIKITTTFGSESSNLTSKTIYEKLLEPSECIQQGIDNSVISEATVYDNQQVYLRGLNHDPILEVMNKVAVFGNQRWLFYFSDQSLGLYNITPVVYSLELPSTGCSDVIDSVQTFIDSTKN